MTKFVSQKKVKDYAYELYQIQQRREELQEELKTLRAQEESLAEFLRNKHPDGFQFADPSSYLMEVQFNKRSMTVMNQKAVRRMLTKLGQRVPTSTPEWVETNVKYVSE